MAPSAAGLEQLPTMAKYTLGALIAFVIIGATAFYVVARFNDGNAETLPAQPVTIVVTDPGPTQQQFDFELDRPTEIRIDNRSGYARALTWDGAEAEQLSNIKVPPLDGQPTPRVYIEASARRQASASVRFTARGTYTLHLVVPQVASSFDIVAHVK